ncbi:MAG TPA: M1 family aminopeptidase [Minicystis sp.]|nr:M1 family aminopeptidase [Minicystis sp.]
MTVEHRHHARCACGSSLGEYHAGAAAKPFVLAGTKRVYERPRPFDIRHIAIDLDLDVPEKAVVGDVRLDVKRVDEKATEIALDAVGFELSSVELSPDGQKWLRADHEYDGETLKVKMPQGAADASIRVRYRAKPRRGLYFLAPDEHVTTRPEQVWTQCQDEDARHVFPCHDKPHIKQTTELTARVPATWFALSNGALVDHGVDGDRARFHWKMDEPHPSYLFTLAAGEFAELTDEAGKVPLTYYVPRGKEDDGRRTFERTPDMIKRFGELTGVPYPWNKYAQIVVSDFIFGGMENTTATTMYEFILLDERAAIDVTSDDLIAHELAHQWFGDYVTCRDWSHGWLNEGFATFMEHVDRESHKGRDEYDYGVKNDMDSYFGEARGRYKRPIVCQDYEAPIDIFDRHLYEKGACVLHMLRRRLGDDVFWRGVNHYLTRHAKGVVETRDLQRALEDVSGQSLDRFFEQWVYRPGHPELEVKIAHDEGLLSVTVKQTQPTSGSSGASGGTSDGTAPLFELDLALDVYDAEDGRVRREVRRVCEAQETFAIPAKARPRFVVVDPELAVLAEVKVEAPADMLREQIRSAKTARGRMLAAEALGKHEDPASLKALARTLEDEKEFWGVRAEAAEALGHLRSDDAFAVLEKNAATAHPKVRRRVAHALGEFRSAKAAEALKKLALRDASYLVEAEAARALGATRQASAFDTLLDVLDRPSWADVVRAGAIDGLANLRDDRATPHVIARTRYGVPARGRRAAILALPKLVSDRKARETLEDLLEERDPYIRVDVVRAIADLGDAKARGALARQLDRDLDGRVRRRIREALRDLGGAGKRETERLREELDAVRAEHGELKARLAKLEAKNGKPEKKHARPKR